MVPYSLGFTHQGLGVSQDYAEATNWIHGQRPYAQIAEARKLAQEEWAN